MKDIEEIAKEKYPDPDGGFWTETQRYHVEKLRQAFISGSQYGKEYSFTREELEARDRERDRRVAAEAWDAAKAYQDCLWDSSMKKIEAPNKEQYINSLKA